jgi:8-oxo-dGTP pyrophosphatase MutT (NUDIX family)
MAVMSVERLRHRLADQAPPDSSAAVALIFAPGDANELLFIERVRRASDPWSGHIALPGGRREPHDDSILQTVVREAREEVGIDLERKAVLLGSLAPQTPGNLPSLLVVPFVFQLRERAEVAPSHEVQAYFWAPLKSLQRKVVEVEIREGIRAPRPAYLYQDKVIWGLTARILDELFEALAGPF